MFSYKPRKNTHLHSSTFHKYRGHYEMCSTDIDDVEHKKRLSADIKKGDIKHVEFLTSEYMLSIINYDHFKVLNIPLYIYRIDKEQEEKLEAERFTIISDTGVYLIIPSEYKNLSQKDIPDEVWDNIADNINDPEKMAIISNYYLEFSKNKNNAKGYESDYDYTEDENSVQYGVLKRFNKSKKAEGLLVKLKEEIELIMSSIKKDDIIKREKENKEEKINDLNKVFESIINQIDFYPNIQKLTSELKDQIKWLEAPVGQKKLIEYQSLNNVFYITLRNEHDPLVFVNKEVLLNEILNIMAKNMANDIRLNMEIPLLFDDVDKLVAKIKNVFKSKQKSLGIEIISESEIDNFSDDSNPLASFNEYKNLYDIPSNDNDQPFPRSLYIIDGIDDNFIYNEVQNAFREEYGREIITWDLFNILKVDFSNNLDKMETFLKAVFNKRSVIFESMAEKFSKSIVKWLSENMKKRDEWVFSNPTFPITSRIYYPPQFLIDIPGANKKSVEVLKSIGIENYIQLLQIDMQELRAALDQKTKNLTIKMNIQSLKNRLENLRDNNIKPRKAVE